jgi:hypothetical protein
MSTSPFRRSLDAEVRAKEAGHNAVLRPDGSVSVVSDSTDGLHWIVRAFAGAVGEPVLFECRADNPTLALGRGHFPLVSQTPGVCPCMHTARAAQRLEREGLVAWDGGVWVTTARAVCPVDVSDAFHGFPRSA